MFSLGQFVVSKEFELHVEDIIFHRGVVYQITESNIAAVNNNSKFLTIITCDVIYQSLAA